MTVSAKGYIQLIHNSPYPEKYLQIMLTNSFMSQYNIHRLVDIEWSGDTVYAYINGYNVYRLEIEYLGREWYIHKYRFKLDTELHVYKDDMKSNNTKTLTRWIFDTVGENNVYNALRLSYKSIKKGMLLDRETMRKIAYTVFPYTDMNIYEVYPELGTREKNINFTELLVHIGYAIGYVSLSDLPPGNKFLVELKNTEESRYMSIIAPPSVLLEEISNIKQEIIGEVLKHV